MSQRNKNILKDVLQLVFLLLSFIFLGLPIIAIPYEYYENNYFTIFNLMYQFNDNYLLSLVATSSLFVVVLTFISFAVMIPVLITTFANNNEVYKVFNLIKKIMLSLLLVFYILFFASFIIYTSSNNVFVLGGIYAIILYILISLCVYIFISLKVKVVEVEEKPGALELETKGNVCPNCGASVNRDDLFCIRCGKKLK